MGMSKKDFIALADALRPMLADGNEVVNVDEPIRRVADFCARQNPEFKRERWLDYLHGECGPNGGAIKGAR